MSLRVPALPVALAVALSVLATSGCQKAGGGVLVQVEVDPGVKAGCVRVVARPAAGGPEQRTAGMPRQDTLKVALYASETLGRDVVVLARGYPDCNESTLPDAKEESAPANVTIPVSGTQGVTLRLERAAVPGDLDGDGFAAKAAGGADCDDTDPSTYPGAKESCGGTGLSDRDCDGRPGCLDEDCAGQACGNDGGCVDQVCQGSLVEVCGDGKDNDADGDVDCLDDQCADQPCNDGTACTQGERCGVDGVGARACIPSTQPGDTVTCTSPPGPCFLKSGTCQPSDGTCTYAVDPDKVNTACDDGLACTVGDTCQADGACTGAPRVCALPNGAKWQCFGAGTCNPADGGCEFPVLLANACDDGDACTLGDHCVADGGCEHASDVSCDAGPCQVSTCVQATGQCKVTSNRPNGLACDDGAPCTLDDACLDGQCAGTPRVCEDGNGCTNNTCNPADGTCVTSFNSLPCNDGNPCTVGDTCIAGTCTAAPKVCLDNNVCTNDQCNPVSGECEYPPAAVTVKCTDNNACTGTNGDDFCNGTGGCLAGTPKSCAVADAQCQVSTCEPATGTCSPPQNLANGTACTDNNACTGDGGVDTCMGGACTPGAAKACPVDDPQCQVPTCDAATGTCGKQNLPDTTVCTDKNLCTGPSGNDSCISGACVSGAPKDCSDGVDCTTDTCDAGTCSHTPDAGLCVDAFSCTTNACDPINNCTYTPDDTLCSPPTCQGVVACNPLAPNATNEGCVFLDLADGTSCAFTQGVTGSGLCVGAGTTPASAGQADCIRAFAYAPSNFAADGGTFTDGGSTWPASSAVLTIPSGCTLELNTTTSALTATGCTAPTVKVGTVVQTSLASASATLLSVAGLEIKSGGTLSITGTRPAIIAVYGNATVAGVVDASANMATAGPGADTGTCSTINASATVTASDGASGGAGGANATLGGAGGDGEGSSSTATGAGVIPAGLSAALKPLYGGCSGGKGGGISGAAAGLLAAGGGGGGAVQLSVAGKLTVSGQLSAAGGAGTGGKVNQPAGANCTSNNTCYGHGGGGGGAGGSILLEAAGLTLKASARISANGGGGGGGAKGANLATASPTANDEGKAGNGGSVSSTAAASGGSGGMSGTGNSGGAGGAGTDGSTITAGTAGTSVTGNNQNPAGGGGGGGLGRIRINSFGTTCRESSTEAGLPTGTSPNVGNAAGFSYTVSGVAGTMPAALGAGQSCP